MLEWSLDELDEGCKDARNFWNEVVYVHENSKRTRKVQDEPIKEEVEKIEEKFESP